MRRQQAQRVLEQIWARGTQDDDSAGALKVMSALGVLTIVAGALEIVAAPKIIAALRALMTMAAPRALKIIATLAGSRVAQRSRCSHFCIQDYQCSSVCAQAQSPMQHPCKNRLSSAVRDPICELLLQPRLSHRADRKEVLARVLERHGLPRPRPASPH